MAHTIVIFGASGDLTSRKLVPALYELSRKRRLPPDTRIVGFSRSEFSDEAWRQKLAETTRQFVGDRFEASLWDCFAPCISYHAGDIGRGEDFHALAARLDQLEGGQPATRVYYLATAPQFYEPAIAHLGQAALADEAVAARRVVARAPSRAVPRRRLELPTSIARSMAR